jgi:vacuolar-type H+-ATPase subunit I/STV1
MKKLDLDTIATIRNGLETLLAILAETEGGMVRILFREDGQDELGWRVEEMESRLEDVKDLNEELASKYADFTDAQKEE